MALLKRVLFIFVLITLFFEQSGFCARSFLLSNKKGKRSIGFSLDFGGSYNFHYSRFTTILTAPDFILGEAHLTMWYRNAIGLYLVYGASAGSVSTPPTIMGGGLKLPIVSFVGGKSGGIINGISLRLVADYMLFKFPPDTTGTQIYETSGGVMRYGGSVVWGLFSSPIYLDTTVLITRFSDTLFLCPYAGLGFQF